MRNILCALARFILLRIVLTAVILLVTLTATLCLVQSAMAQAVEHQQVTLASGEWTTPTGRMRWDGSIALDAALASGSGSVNLTRVDIPRVDGRFLQFRIGVSGRLSTDFETRGRVIFTLSDGTEYTVYPSVFSSPTGTYLWVISGTVATELSTFGAALSSLTDKTVTVDFYSRLPIPRAPTFGDPTGDAQTWTQNADIRPVTVPETVAAFPTPTYAVVGSLPNGLTFNAATRVLSGRPTETGTGTITIRATNSGGMADWTMAYTTLDMSGDATLSELTLSEGTLAPAFASYRTAYTASVGSFTTETTVAATTNTDAATLTINGDESESRNDYAIPLNAGANPITIVVTAGDGSTTETYTITVTRAGRMRLPTPVPLPSPPQPPDLYRLPIEVWATSNQSGMVRFADKPINYQKYESYIDGGVAIVRDENLEIVPAFTPHTTATQTLDWALAFDVTAGRRSRFYIDMGGSVNELWGWPLHNQVGVSGGGTFGGADLNAAQITNNLRLEADILLLPNTGAGNVISAHSEESDSLDGTSGRTPYWFGVRDVSGTKHMMGQVQDGLGDNDRVTVDCGVIPLGDRARYGLEYDVGGGMYSLRCYVNGNLVAETQGETGGAPIYYSGSTVRWLIGTSAYPSSDTGCGDALGNLSGVMYGARIGENQNVLYAPNFQTGITYSHLREGSALWPTSDSEQWYTRGTLGDAGAASVGTVLGQSDGWEYKQCMYTAVVNGAVQAEVDNLQSLYTDSLPGTGDGEDTVNIGIGGLTERNPENNIASMLFDPIRLAVENSALGEESGFVLFMTFLGIIFASLVVTVNREVMFQGFALVLAMALGSSLDFYSWWITYFYAFVCASVVIIYKRGGVSLGGSSVPTWVATLAMYGALVALMEAIYAGTTNLNGQLNSLHVVGRFQVLENLSLFGFETEIPFINFGYFAALIDVLTPSFTVFFTGNLFIIGALLQMVFGGMIAVIVIRWLTPLVSAVGSFISNRIPGAG